MRNRTQSRRPEPVQDRVHDPSHFVALVLGLLGLPVTMNVALGVASWKLGDGTY